MAAQQESNQELSSRQIAMGNLVNAYKSFMEIKSNLTEGIKFYNDFQSMILKFQTNCKDFVMAREMDKRDALSRLPTAPPSSVSMPGVWDSKSSHPPQYLSRPPQ